MLAGLLTLLPDLRAFTCAIGPSADANDDAKVIRRANLKPV
jgi:hypothetical protein